MSPWHIAPHQAVTIDADQFTEKHSSHRGIGLNSKKMDE